LEKILLQTPNVVDCKDLAAALEAVARRKAWQDANRDFQAPGFSTH
jgi:hypothetical protein